jgi:hypothetical protein
VSSGPRVRIAAAVSWCGYCAPDPDQLEVLTAWRTDDRCRIRPWPFGTRWEPRPAAGIFGAERNAWHDSTYRPWRWAVADGIEADLETAARVFAGRTRAPSSRGRRSRCAARRPNETGVGAGTVQVFQLLAAMRALTASFRLPKLHGCTTD